MRGAWIEICHHTRHTRKTECRSPCGGRGLKYRIIVRSMVSGMSLPMRGAWIEMMMNTYRLTDLSVAPHAGSVD